METVYIVEDDATTRQALASCLATPTRECRDHKTAEEFLAAYVPVHPACLILDLALPGMNGMELLRHLRIATRALKIPTIVLTGHADVPTAVEAIKMGAIDFLLKPADPPTLSVRVQASLSLDLLHATQDERVLAARRFVAGLSKRERTLLQMLTAGQSSKQISRELLISVKTVSNHRARLLMKMHAGNTADLIRTAMLAGVDDESEWTE